MRKPIDRLAEADLIANMEAGLTCTNIHNSNFPGGEIRGQLAPAGVPEPRTIAFGAAGLLILGFRKQRR